MNHQHHPVSQHENHTGHNAPMHADHHLMMIADFRQRFYATLLLSIPILALSPMIQHWLGLQWHFTADRYILLALSTLVYLYGGWPFLKGWLDEMKGRNPGMMTLIGFAITAAFIYSAATVFGLAGMDFFWELATLILIMLLGHWIEMKSVAGASKELELLVKLMPDEAHLVDGKQIRDVKTDLLKEDHIILVRPGEKIAADGIVIEGKSTLNESMLTGESKPVQKREKDQVIAGAINGAGSLKIRVSHEAKDSYLSQVVRLVENAQHAKSKTQLLADTAAKWLTLIAIVAGIITFSTWYFLVGRDLAYAIERMVTVIVICCPHALGLAIPLVVARSTSLSAKNGLLIKNRTAFENARKINKVVFDKTGTLTLGKFEVTQIRPLEADFSEQQLLGYAAALEQHSEHPIASGILAKAVEQKIDIPKVANFHAITGSGIAAEVAGQSVQVVSPSYLHRNHISLPDNYQEKAVATTVFVLVNNRPKGYITLADSIRKESSRAIAILRNQGIESVLLTGDNRLIAQSVAEEVGINQYFAEVLPHQKLEKIKALQEEGAFVAMTGDGVNDAPALAQANIGIAIGSGSDIAAETADIVLVNSNPMDVTKMVLFGKATYRKMIQNLAWATGYNIVAMPLAAGVLAPLGILLSPAAGAVLMSLSTIVAAINASLLKVKG